MASIRQDEQDEAREQLLREALTGIIREQVIHSLGKPDDLIGVQVRPLWEGRYRANVFIGTHVASARVAHSYFLAVASDGTISASSPKITRQY